MIDVKKICGRRRKMFSDSYVYNSIFVERKSSNKTDISHL